MSTKRVHYREHQALRKDDLADEQAYRVAQRRRHNVAHHHWGIVKGLDLSGDVSSQGIKIAAGFAIDGYGRELIVPQDVLLIRSQLDDALGCSGAIDLWLHYRRFPDTNGSGTTQHTTTRIREESWLELVCVPKASNPSDMPDRATDESEELEIPPYIDPTDDDQQEWPVYLGRIQHEGERYSVGEVDVHVRYASALAGKVCAPWGEPWLILDQSPSGRMSLVALGIHDREGRMQAGLTISGKSGNELIGGLHLRSLGKDAPDLDLAPENTLAADIGTGTAAPASTEESYRLTFQSLSTLPAAPSPWTIYGVNQPPATGKNSQLRFEIANPGDQGDPSLYEFTICSNPESSVLSVRADDTVVVEGNVCVLGQLIEGEVDIDIADERFRDALLERWTKGLIVAGTEVDAFYGTKLKINIDIIAADAVACQTYTISVTVINQTTDKVPLLRADLEIRDDDRQVVHRDSKDVKAKQIILGPRGTKGETVILEPPFSYIPTRFGPMTVSIGIVSLGAAQNEVITTVSKTQVFERKPDT